MSDVIIKAEGVGKSYCLAHRAPRERYTALRDVLARGARDCWNTARRGFRGRQLSARDRTEEFWALRDVSFEIKHGEVVGIIGRNGAGKSTLLKILSRITELTEGRVRIGGRIASLLEVGTGFHPELTGRENIYLNGSILGMTRAEIRRKFDEIVAFADVEKFLDTPVKRYSSGMRVRLAFSVAAHMEPEILVIDEVLAVGDAAFQKKCLGKMGEIAEGGRTVLFVSHQMNAVERLCHRIILLQRGRLIEDSHDVRQTINTYLHDDDAFSHATVWENSGSEFANPWFVPRVFYLGDSQGRRARMPMRNDEPAFVYISGVIDEPDPTLSCGYALYSADGALLYRAMTTDEPEEQWPAIARGPWSVASRLPGRLLNEGDYRLELIVTLYARSYICQPGVNSPTLLLQVRGGLSDSPYWTSKREGELAPVLSWHPAAVEMEVPSGCS